MKKSILSYGLVYGFYLAVAALITYPLVAQFSTHFAGDLPGSGDAYEYARHVWWFKHALQTGQPLFFHPLLAYPDGIPGAHLWANLLQSFPASLFAFVMPLPAAFNLMILLRLALNGWAMWFLSYQLINHNTKNYEPQRHEGHEEEKVECSVLRTQHTVLSTHYSSLITRHFFPSLLAGLIFLAFPTVQSHLAASHSGLVVLWPFPLYVYSLLRVAQTGGRRWYALSALFFVLGCIGNYALVMYVLAPLTAFMLLKPLLQRDWLGLCRIFVAVVCGGLASLVFLLPAAIEILNQPQIQFGGAFNFSADLLAFAAPPTRNPLFSALDYPRYILGGNVVEGAGYIGIAAAVLSLIGIVRFRATRGWLALLLVAWVLSLGPLLKLKDAPVVLTVGGEVTTFVTLPWALVQNLPLVNIARTPARFNFTVAFALAVLAGYGAAALWRWLDRARWMQFVRVGILMAAMGWIVFEYQLFAPFPMARADLPQALYDLAERDDIRAVFDLPWNSPAGKDALYVQTAHEQPMIAGAVTRGTPADHAMLWVLQQTLDPALLDAAGVDVIILHRRWAGSEAFDEAFTRAQLGEPFYEDDRFALFNVPDPTAPAEFVALPDPQSLALGSWSSYFYAPSSGWAVWNGTLQGESVGVEVLLEGDPVHHWTLDGSTDVSLPLWLPSAGYYTAAVQPSPYCPPEIAFPLMCSPASLSGLTINGFMQDSPDIVSFADGITLNAAYVPLTAQAGATLPVYLAWEFGEPRRDTDVRFIHVLDAGGEPVAQIDAPIGSHEANTSWSEAVELMLPAELPAGEYRVYAGWYTYPEIANFCVIENGACVSNEALLGTVLVQ